MVVNVVEELQNLFTKRGWTLSVAESCTGGAMASAIVQQPGASDFFKGGIVSYVEEAKVGMLGVKKSSLAACDAVSLPVALQMAKGVRRQMGSSWSVSTTGYAGPDGGSDSYPVGSVCVAVVGPGFEWRGWHLCETQGRDAFIEEATKWALTQLLEKAKN